MEKTELTDWETFRATFNFSVEIRINILKDAKKVSRFKIMKLRHSNQRFKFRFLVSVFPFGVDKETEGWLVVLPDMRVPRHEPRPRDYGILSCTVSVIDAEGNSRLPRSFVEIPSEEEDRFPRYLERSTILRRKDEFLTGDILTLCCDIHFYLNTVFREGLIHRILKDFLRPIPQELCYRDESQTGDLSDNSKRGLHGISKRDLSDNSERDLHDNSKRDMSDNSKRELRGNSKRDVRDNSKMDQHGNSKRDLHGNSKRDQDGNSKRDVDDNSKRDLSDNSKRDLSDNFKRDLDGNSKRDQDGNLKRDVHDKSKRDLNDAFTVFDFTHQILTLPPLYELRRKFGVSCNPVSLTAYSSDSKEDNTVDIVDHVWMFDTDTVRFLLSLDERQDSLGVRLLKSSPVIERMVNSDMKERRDKRVPLPDITSRTFVIVLYFLEKEMLPTSENRDFLDVYKFAHFHEMKLLQRRCSEAMVKSVVFPTEELKRTADDYSDLYLSKLLESRRLDYETVEQPRFKMEDRPDADCYI